MPSQSSSRPTSRRAGPPVACSAWSARRPTKSALSRSTSRPSPISNGRVVLLGVQGVAGRRVVDLEQDQAGLEPDDVEGEHARRPDAVRAPASISASHTSAARSAGIHSS